MAFRQGSLFLSLALSSCVMLCPQGFARRFNTAEGETESQQTKKAELPKDLQVPDAWKTLIDPNTEEFWSEGNYRPDAGFLLWARNPTFDNARLYLLRMNMKRDRLHVMQKQQEAANKELIQQGLIANDYNFLPMEQQQADGAAPFSADVQIFFLFGPECAHSSRQAAILANHKNVVPMQVGGKELKSFKGLPPSVWASVEDIQRYLSDGAVPVLLLYQSRTNKIGLLKGVHSLSEISQAVDTLLNKK